MTKSQESEKNGFRNKYNKNVWNKASHRCGTYGSVLYN